MRRKPNWFWYLCGQIRSPSYLKVGRVFHEVTAMGENSRVGTRVVTVAAFIDPETESIFIKDRDIDRPHHVGYDRSLLDHNVIPNHYNAHRLFRWYWAAELYARYCRAFDIGPGPEGARRDEVEPRCRYRDDDYDSYDGQGQYW